ncbi:MAG TPA: lytic murein transglycosylase, partial [Solirubrobacteraceae bacterium]|nr:lytic murein transglycosylase [Solirubrobacteraceae bacterium]
MGRQPDDHNRGMTPAERNRSVRRAWRMVLSALAGSGITAVTLGGPLAAKVLGATGTVPQTVSEGGQESGSTTPSGSPTTSTGTTSTGTTPSTTVPKTTTTSEAQPTTQTGPLIVTPAPETTSGARAPGVVVQRRQKTTRANPSTPKSSSTTKSSKTAKPGTAANPAGSNVALPPELVAAQANILAAELAGSAASVQALAFYRIPLFLLPIYHAAAAQYGVPWQILAAINEIETDYGNDLSVSTAGAVGWMQFMPATWIQYGVDALNAGYADPYNPVDAIFAAARYLRAAGASSNLRAAILAYNHSAEYVSSVLLRAKLISSYPNPVISTLTGLTDGRLPVRNGQLAWDSIARLISPSSATAQATAVPGGGAGSGALGGLSEPGAPGSSSAPAPTAAAAASKGHTPPQPLQLADLLTGRNASVVAVQDGRIVKVGSSRALGKYVVLRDTYGDVFTYAGLGSIASTYQLPKAPHVAGVTAAALAAGDGLTQPGKQPSAAKQPLTLHVRAHPAKHAAHRAAAASLPANGKVRLFAHPGNPDALAAAARDGAHQASSSAGSLPLRAGAIVTKGTVLGQVRTPAGGKDGHLRFAIRPAGDLSTVDPRPILQNWSQLNAALHPQGSHGENDLLGATASGVFLLSKSDLERDVLADPGITIPACGRQDIAAGAVDRRILAVLAFLSRSGLKPTVNGLRCAHESSLSPLASQHDAGRAVDITAIDGIPIASHQGPGTVTDVAIRTLLTLRGEFLPQQIVSLMQYPGAANTQASPEVWDHIHISYAPLSPAAQTSPAAAAAIAHASRAHAAAPAPLLFGGELNGAQWNQLFTHIAALPAPKVAA